MVEVDLTDEQQAVLDRMVEWYRGPGRVLTVGGYAGVGKTLLIGRLGELGVRPGGVALTAPTGKAVSVLRDRMRDTDLQAADCSTLHSLLYHPELNAKREVVGWRPKANLDLDLLVIDEASMVQQPVWQDVLESRCRKVLCVGDHGQLPPVNSMFSLMASPDLRLETVHRQALDNPILAAATFLRSRDVESAVRQADGRHFWVGAGQAYLEQAVSALPVGLSSAIVCHRNATRTHLNDSIRSRNGRSGPPAVGDIVLVLKNKRELQLYNGQRGVVRAVDHREGLWFYLTLEVEDGLVEVQACRYQFGQAETFKSVDDFVQKVGVKVQHVGQLGVLADYGYAMTCHKAQGSGFDDVVVVVEKSVFGRNQEEGFPYRWLYTAATRAANRLVMVWI